MKGGEDMDEDQNMAGQGKVNPIQVQKFLDGMDYPVSKDDLVKYAQGKGADENVLNTLRRLPEQDYETPVDVSEAIGQFE